MEAGIEVRIAHGILRKAIEEQAGALGPAGGTTPRTVVSTTGDMTPVQAAQAVASGAIVIILAVMPRAGEERAYTAAGARYLPMSPGESRWTDALREFLSQPRSLPSAGQA